MRRTPTLLIVLAAWCGLHPAKAAAADAFDQVGKVVVRRIDGAARCRQTEPWRPLKAGDQLAPGIVVKTGKESRVELAFPGNQAILSLLEDGTIRLNKVVSRKIRGQTECDHELALQAGRIEAEVAPLAATSKFEVKVPDGVIGVRGNGTRFSLAADFSLRVDRGSVVLVYANKEKSGKEVLALVVNAGQKFNPISLKVEPTGR